MVTGRPSQRTPRRPLFEAGAEQVVLYTDLANRTSNKIYQAIGYLPDHDFEEHSFIG